MKDLARVAVVALAGKGSKVDIVPEGGEYAWSTVLEKKIYIYSVHSNNMKQVYILCCEMSVSVSILCKNQKIYIYIKTNLWEFKFILLCN